jgi:hypothetical protein
MKEFVRRSTSVPFRRFLWDVRRQFMQRLSLALRSTLGSYLRDALHEGVTVVGCLPPCSEGLGFRACFISSLLVDSSTSFLLHKTKSDEVFIADTILHLDTSSS